MENEHKLLIVEDYGADTITIYWKSRSSSYREEWYYFEDSKFMCQTFEKSEGLAPQSRKPLFVFPYHMGKLFLELIGSEIEKNGYNQKKQDMQAGKLEILESELSFNKEQLTKFIDHFTK
jgi:hypothetical protein